METNKLIAGIVAAAIAIIVLAGVLMPALSNATTTEDKFQNEGLYFMEKVTSDDDREWVLEYTKEPYSLTMNGSDIDVSTLLPDDKRYTFATDGENWLIRYSSAIPGFAYIEGLFTVTMTNVVSETITISSGTVTFEALLNDNTTVEKTQTYTDLWIFSFDKTDWVMKSPSVPAYMLKDSPFYGYGTTTITNWYDFISVTGTVEDYDAVILYPEVTTTTTNKVVVDTEISGYVDLYSLDKLTFTISDGTNTVNATYSYFIVPAEVTAEKAVHLSDAMNVILNVIPLLIIVAVLLGVVAVFILRRE